MLSVRYIQLKTDLDWDIPLACGKFKDTNDEAVWVRILFSTTEKLKKIKLSSLGGVYGLHLLSPRGTFSKHGTTQFLGHLLCRWSHMPCTYIKSAICPWTVINQIFDTGNTPTAKYHYILYMYRCMGVYRCIGESTNVWHIWPYIGMYWEHTDILGDIQIRGYRCMGECTDVWGHRYMGDVQMCEGSYRHPQTYRLPDISPHACQPQVGTIFLIKFKFVPYRHILLARQLS